MEIKKVFKKILKLIKDFFCDSSSKSQPYTMKEIAKMMEPVPEESMNNLPRGFAVALHDILEYEKQTQ